MAIGIDQIYLSMTNSDTGEYETANVYTVESKGLRGAQNGNWS